MDPLRAAVAAFAPFCFVPWRHDNLKTFAGSSSPLTVNMSART